MLTNPKVKITKKQLRRDLRDKVKELKASESKSAHLQKMIDTITQRMVKKTEQLTAPRKTRAKKAEVASNPQKRRRITKNPVLPSEEYAEMLLEYSDNSIILMRIGVPAKIAKEADRLAAVCSSTEEGQIELGDFLANNYSQEEIAELIANFRAARAAAKAARAAGRTPPQVKSEEEIVEDLWYELTKNPSKRRRIAKNPIVDTLSERYAEMLLEYSDNSTILMRIGVPSRIANEVDRLAAVCSSTEEGQIELGAFLEKNYSQEEIAELIANFRAARAAAKAARAAGRTPPQVKRYHVEETPDDIWRSFFEKNPSKRTPLKGLSAAERAEELAYRAKAQATRQAKMEARVAKKVAKLRTKVARNPDMLRSNISTVIFAIEDPGFGWSIDLMYPDSSYDKEVGTIVETGKAFRWRVDQYGKGGTATTLRGALDNAAKFIVEKTDLVDPIYIKQSALSKPRAKVARNPLREGPDKAGGMSAFEQDVVSNPRRTRKNPSKAKSEKAKAAAAKARAAIAKINARLATAHKKSQERAAKKRARDRAALTKNPYSAELMLEQAESLKKNPRNRRNKRI